MILGKTARVFLIGFNSIILLFGLIILGVGIWVSVDKNFNLNWKEIDKNDVIGAKKIGNAGYLLITMGVLLFLIGFNGFVGAIKKIRALLILYLLLICLLLIVELITVYFLVSFNSGLKESFEKQFNQTVTSARNGSLIAMQVTNFTQSVFECCGSKDISDWEGLTPMSCIKNNITFDIGCSNAVPEQLSGKIYLILGVVFIIMLIEILVIMLTICLCTSVDEFNSKISYYK